MGRPSAAEVAARGNADAPAATHQRVRLNAAEVAAEIRRTRSSISSIKKRLPDFVDNPGWKRRWVNDDNIANRKQEGYRFVTKDEINDVSYDASRDDQDPANYVCRPVGGINDKNELRSAYLMEVPQEIADELDFEKSLKQSIANKRAILDGTAGAPQSSGQTRMPDGVTNKIS